MAELRLRDVRKSYGTTQILHGIDLAIEAGEFVVFVGPSGCGKSTLLRAIAGLEEITSGTLEIGGVVANRIPPGGRGIAMVFQSYALYPHMTVFQNMAFGLKLERLPRAEIDARVRRAAEMLQLTPLLDRLPRHLSGGQRQRVAIGRAITRNPRVFLFDEPLSNLDAALRVATRVEIANLKDALPNTTMVYVTHDQVEAMTLADRIVVLNAGRIEQIGTPMDLYHRPANIFVARFIGSPAMNTIPVPARGTPGATLVGLSKGNEVSIPIAAPESLRTQEMILGIRPEHLRLLPKGETGLAGRILAVENLGEMTILHADVGRSEPVIAKISGGLEMMRGTEVLLGFDAAHAHLFTMEGQSLRQIETDPPRQAA